MIMPQEIQELIHKYIYIYNERPKSFNYDEWNNLDEYRKYLEKELERSE